MLWGGHQLVSHEPSQFNQVSEVEMEVWFYLDGSTLHQQQQLCLCLMIEMLLKIVN